MPKYLNDKGEEIEVLDTDKSVRYLNDDGYIEGEEITPANTWLGSIGPSITSFMSNHPRIKEMSERFLTGTSPEYEKMLKEKGITQVLGTPESELSLLPEWKKQPETFAGGFAKSIYEDFIRPLATPSGFAGSAEPRIELPLPKNKLLPPARNRFEVGPTGVADTSVGQQFPIRRSKEIPYRPERTPLPRTLEMMPGGTVDIPASYSTAAGDTPRAQEAWRNFVAKTQAEALPVRQPRGLLTEGVRPPDINDLLINEHGGFADDIITPRREGPIDWGPRHDYDQALIDEMNEEISKTNRMEFLDPNEPANVRLKRMTAEGETPLISSRPFSRVNEDVSFARTESGKLKMGLKEGPVIQILKKFYEGDPSTIATKELLQNSIDEVAAAHKKTGEGKINVNFDDKAGTITVEDNGRGMTREQIETIYTNIGDTGKKSSETVGGFGVAKAAIQLGGENVTVETIARNPKTKKLEKTSYSTTPEDLVAGNVNHVTEEVPENTPTGTKVIFKAPAGKSFYDAKNFVNNLTENSSFNGEITHNAGKRYGRAEPKTVSSMSREPAKKIGTINKPYADMTISIPHGTPNVETQNIQLILSNKGMFQGIQNFPLDNPMKVPQQIAVDISSKVDALHDDYAFNPSRERLKWKAMDDVTTLIDEHVVNKSKEHRKNELQKLYDSIPDVHVGRPTLTSPKGRKIAVHDTGRRLTPEEFKFITESPTFKTLADDIGTTIDEVVEVMKAAYPDAEWTERLDRIGIILDDKLHGIHIPNPQTGHSMILVNPFEAASRGIPIDQAAGNTIHTILHEVAHMDPYIHGHNESFTVRLGEVYKNYGARKEVNALNRLEKSFGGDTGEYHPEFQEILQRYTESRGREATSEDLITGTGIGSKSGPKGEGDIPIGRKPTGKRASRKVKRGDTSGVVNKLLENLEEAKGLREEQEAIYTRERAKRFARFEGVKGEGQEWANKAMSKMRGEYEKVDASHLQLDQDEVDTLFSAIKQSGMDTPGKVQAINALRKMLNGEGIPQRNEIITLNKVFGNGFGERIVEMHGGLGAVSFHMAKAANTMKAMKSMIDLSAPMRQGIGMIHRKEYRDAFKAMLKYPLDKAAFNADMEALKRTPHYKLAQDSGLFIAEPQDLLQGEEAFLNSYVNKIPGVGKLAGASERAYIGFLNKLRMDTFKNLIDEAQLAGFPASSVRRYVDEEGVAHSVMIPSKVAKNLANYVNVNTGRGSLGKLEKIAPELNALFWSPRLVSSRLQQINPKYWINMDPFTRRQAVKSVVGMMAFGASALGLAAAAGAKIGTNPLSADFMKARIGNKVIDPWAGHQQEIVALARMIANSTDTRKQDPFTTAFNFGTNKLGPAASVAHDISRAQERNVTKMEEGSLNAGPDPIVLPGLGGYVDRYGQQKYMNRELSKQFIPMFLENVNDIAKEDPSILEAISFLVPSYFGVGTQTYPEAERPGFRRFRRSF